MLSCPFPSRGASSCRGLGYGQRNGQGIGGTLRQLVPWVHQRYTRRRHGGVARLLGPGARGWRRRAGENLPPHGASLRLTAPHCSALFRTAPHSASTAPHWASLLLTVHRLEPFLSLSCARFATLGTRRIGRSLAGALVLSRTAAGSLSGNLPHGYQRMMHWGCIRQGGI